MGASSRVGLKYLAGSFARHRLLVLRRGLQNALYRQLPDVPVGELVSSEAVVTETLPSREIQVEAPGGLDAADVRAMALPARTVLPAQFVVELPQATLLGREGWVIHENRAVAGLWQHKGAGVVPLRARGDHEEPVHLPGTTVSLLMPWLPNYYHWTVQTVPRALAMREVLGERVRDVDHWLLSGATSPQYEHEWLDLLGVPRDRRVHVAGRRQAFHLDHLVVASVPGSNQWVSRELVATLRKTVEQFSGPSAGRRVFIQRFRDVRTLVNAAEVAEALASRGFDLVDAATLSLEDEVRLFSSADLVVGVHGAGLTNLVYCHPGGSDVVEIAPRGLVYPTFVKLAAAAGVVHHVVVGREPRLPRAMRFPDLQADVVADVPALLKLVDRLIVERSDARLRVRHGDDPTSTA